MIGAISRVEAKDSADDGVLSGDHDGPDFEFRLDIDVVFSLFEEVDGRIEEELVELHDLFRSEGAGEAHFGGGDEGVDVGGGRDGEFHVRPSFGCDGYSFRAGFCTQHARGNRGGRSARAG